MTSPANILIVNHTRMGDLIQTIPVIAGLRAAHPGAKVTLLANVKFAGIVRFMEGVDELLLLDLARFVPDPPGGEVDLYEVYRYLDQLTAGLAARRFDLAVNLSHSKLSAMIVQLAGIPDVRGFAATPRGERVVRDPWLIYFSAFLPFRRYSRFNLVDLYLKASAVEPSPSLTPRLAVDREAAARVTARCTELGIAPGDTVVAIQAGASRADRRWPPERFAAVADRLARERGAKILLFGAASEKELGGQVAAAMASPAVNLIGATGLAELVAWTARADLLVTNDTGTMHVAAAVGTRIVALFFVHAKPEETGPYCDGATVLMADIPCAPCGHQTVCDHYSCFTCVTVDDVAAAAFHQLNGTPLPSRADGLFGRALAYTTRLGPSGGIDLVPQPGGMLTVEELCGRIYRELMPELLACWDDADRIETQGNGGAAVAPVIRERFVLPGATTLARWNERIADGAARMVRLAGEGEEAAARIARGQGVAGAPERIGGIDREIARLGQVAEPLLPLAALHGRRTENYAGGTPEALGAEAARGYRWLARGAGRLAGAVNETIVLLSTDAE